MYSHQSHLWEAALLSTQAKTVVKFVVDSGCTAHATNNGSVCQALAAANVVVETAGGKLHPAAGKALTQGLVANSSHKMVPLHLQLLYIPTFAHNLLSVTQLQDQGHTVEHAHVETFAPRDPQPVSNMARQRP